MVRPSYILTNLLKKILAGSFFCLLSIASVAEPVIVHPLEPVFVKVAYTSSWSDVFSKGNLCTITSPDGRKYKNMISSSRMWPLESEGSKELLLYVDRPFDQPTVFQTTGTYSVVVSEQTNTVQIIDYEIPAELRDVVTRKLLYRIATFNGESDSLNSEISEICRRIFEYSEETPYRLYAETYLAAEHLAKRISTLAQDYEGRALPDMSDVLNFFEDEEPPISMIGGVYLYHLSRAQAFVDKNQSLTTLTKLANRYPASPVHALALKKNQINNFYE